jgi:hypothetical protein
VVLLTGDADLLLFLPFVCVISRGFKVIGYADLHGFSFDKVIFNSLFNIVSLLF